MTYADLINELVEQLIKTKEENIQLKNKLEKMKKSPCCEQDDGVQITQKKHLGRAANRLRFA